MSTIAQRYELGEVIGTGGMSDVYAAQDTLLGRGVAVKVLRLELARDVNFRERFRREAQNSGKLNHPAIVAVYDTGETMIDGISVPYIVMERVFGRTLRDIVREDGPMSPADAAATLIPAAQALQASHDAGIIHRDIKPANIMITNTGAVKVMDFGIARALNDTSSAMTQTAAVIGTAQYLSPEQARGRNADARSDIYSLGCVLYELITGRPPFEGDTPFAVAYQHVQEDPDAPSHSIPDLTPTAAVNVDSVVLTAMAKHPADRYQTAVDFAADLELLSRNAVTQAARSHVSTGAGGVAPTQAFNDAAPTQVTPAQPGPRRAASQQRPTQQRPAQQRGPRGEVAPTGRTEAAASTRHAAPEQQTSSHWPAWVAGILAVVVIGVGGAFAYDYASNKNNDGSGSSSSQASDTIELPDVTNKKRGPAQKQLEDLGLSVTVKEEPSPTIAQDVVIRTNPTAHSALRPGTSVELVVSSGKEQTDVPNLKGMTIEGAAQALKSAGLVLNEQVSEEPSDATAQGLVLSQDPPASAHISKGSPVTITVSSGPKQVSVPNLAGMKLSDAQTTLDGLGLRARIVYVDSTEDKDTVVAVRQAGNTVDHTATVDVQVSNGELFVLPDVAGLSRGDALRKLHDAGWKAPDSALAQGDPVPTTDPAQRDTVAHVSPRPGTEMRRDDLITVQMYDFNLLNLVR